MKQLSIEEKAEAYDKVVNKLKGFIMQGVDPLITRADVQDFFPELGESEDESIRKHIISVLEDCWQTCKNIDYDSSRIQEDIAWLKKQGKKERDSRYKYLEKLLEADTIYQMAMNDAMVEEAKAKALEAISNMEIFELLGIEKQGEQKPIISNDAIREGIAHFGITQYQIDNWLKKYIDVEKQGEQKPADKVEPKFNVGDKIRRKTPSSYDKDMQVARIKKDYYICNHIGQFSSEVVLFSKESSYELIEQKPDWSEEDERVLKATINTVLISRNSCEEDDDIKDRFDDELNWLESLKQRLGG